LARIIPGYASWQGRDRQVWPLSPRRIRRSFGARAEFDRSAVWAGPGPDRNRGGSLSTGWSTRTAGNPFCLRRDGRAAGRDWCCDVGVAPRRDGGVGLAAPPRRPPVTRPMIRSPPGDGPSGNPGPVSDRVVRARSAGRPPEGRMGL
jgi:hypothetical protein